MKLICFTNQKGGVGKTATTLTCGLELAKRGYKVLLIDLDAQASLSQLLGVQAEKNQKTVADFIGARNEKATLEETVVKLNQVDMIPANILLSVAEQTMPALDNNANLLSRALREVRNAGIYDYVLIDCPPSLGILMKNALMASDTIVVPVKPEKVSIMGLELLLGTIVRLSESYGKEFDISGFLLTMCNARTNSFKTIKADIEQFAEQIGTRVFKSTIRQSVRCSNVIGEGGNIIDDGSGVSGDYKAFVDELISIVGGNV